MGIALVIIIVASLCPVVVVPLAIVIPVVLANPPTLPAGLRGQNGKTLALVIGGAVLIGGLIVLVLLVGLGFMIKRRYDHDMANHRAKKEDYEQNQLRPYQRAKERWDQSFYCKWDGIVFILAENKAVPAEDLEKYLHDPYYKY